MSFFLKKTCFSKKIKRFLIHTQEIENYLLTNRRTKMKKIILITTLIASFLFCSKDKENLKEEKGAYAYLLSLLINTNNTTQTKKRISLYASGNTLNHTFTDYTKDFRAESISIDLKSRTLSYYNSEGKLLNQTPIANEMFNFYIKRIATFSEVAGAKDLQSSLEACLFNRLTCDKPLPDTNRSFYDTVIFEGTEKMTFDNAKWQEQITKTSDGGFLIEGKSSKPTTNLQRGMTRREASGIDIAGVKISAEDISRLNSTLNAIDTGCVRGNSIFYAAIGLGLSAATGNYFFFDQLSRYGNSQDKQECSREEQLKKEMEKAAELDRRSRMLIQERKEKSFQDGKELNEAEFPLDVLSPGNGGLLTVAYGRTIDFKVKSSVASSIQVSLNGYPVGYMEPIKDGDQNTFTLALVPEVGMNTIRYSAQSTVGGKVKTGSLFFEVRR